MHTDIRDLLDKLLDEDYWENVELINDRGDSALFEQICVIPESEETCYAMLQPIDSSGNELGDFIVFVFGDADTEEVTIDVVTDQYKIREIYDEYRRIRSAEEDDEVEDEADGEADGDDSTGE